MKKLYLSDEDGFLGGVLGGIAKWSGIDSTIVRFLFILAAIFCHGFPFIFAYVVAWIIIPHEPKEEEI